MKRVLTLCLFVLLAWNVNGQSPNVDSLVNVLHTTKVSSEQLELYYKICGTYLFYDLDNAHKYAGQGLELALKEKDKTKASMFYAIIGRIYSTRANFDTALTYYEKALDFAREADSKAQEAAAYADIGIVYAIQDKYTDALAYWIKALSIYEESGDKIKTILVMNNLGSMYRSMDNDERAIYYLEKTKVLAEEIEHEETVMQTYAGLGAIYYKQAEHDSSKTELALEYELKAYELSNKLNDKRFQASITHVLSEIYLVYIKDYDKALEYAKESVQHAQNSEDPKILIAALGSVSNAYRELKRYKESDEVAMEAWEIDSADIHMGTVILTNIVLSNIALGNKDKAALFFGKYGNLIKRHIDQSSRETLADMEVKYETEKKEMRIASLEKERQLYVWLCIAGVLLVSTLAIVLWLTIRNARKERLLIATRSVLDGEMRERARLSHDLHDRLSGNLSAVKIELDDQMESLQHVRDKLDKCIREVREAAHDIMPPSLRFGLKVALEDFTAQFPTVRFHFFGKENRLEKRMEFVVYCCANELVTNAIRHSGAKNINIQLVQGEKHIALTVQDDGCGFDEKTVTEGVGLQSIRDRVASCNGKMDIFSSPGKGTEIIIEINV
jgi:signal transduction histidine kinase